MEVLAKVHEFLQRDDVAGLIELVEGDLLARAVRLLRVKSVNFSQVRLYRLVTRVLFL